MLRYLSDLLLAHTDLPVLQYLVYIGKPALAMPDGLDLPDFSYRYRVLDMHRIGCRTLLDLAGPGQPRRLGAGGLVRLPRQEAARDNPHHSHPPAGTPARHLPPRLREYVEMLDILAGNRDLNLNIREELDMLTIDIEKLATFQLRMEKGMKRGKEEGKELGAHIQSAAIAQKLLAMGMDPARIARATDLPIAEVEALRQGKTD